MPEGDGFPPDQAVRRIAERFAAAGISGRKLEWHELARYRGEKFIAGWEFRIQFSDRTRRLRLLIPENAPWVFSRIALDDAPPFLTWPHVEKDGLLCLRPNSWTVDPSLPEEAALDELGRATELIERLITNGGDADFRNEFRSYWDHICDHKAGPIFSVAVPGPPSRQVHVWRGQQFSLIADSPQGIDQWLRARFPDITQKQMVIERAGLIWLNNPPVPAEFPDSIAKLKELAAQNKTDLFQMLDGHQGTDGGEFLVIFGAESTSGIGFIGVSISRNTSKFGNQSIEKGFRKGKVPKALMANRTLNGRVVPRTVDRADAAWVHGRDQDSRQMVLQKAHVAVLGCGSVGGQVAELLASAGVGSLLLVDPERLTWSNVGRHVLGAEFVELSKAESIARQLGKRFPHIRQIEARRESWQGVVRASAGTLAHCNLIVSTMGDWSSECQLNTWHSEEIPDVPILYGWTEAYCCAGHAVVIRPEGGCFQCGFSRNGRVLFPVARWPEGATIRREPACGADFQPYGPIELAHVCATIAEFALDCLLEAPERSTHRVWSGAERLLIATGGQWTEQWAELTGGSVLGSRQLQRNWETASDCPICGKKPDA
ncbi:ThiF family adenylyltransferase [Caulifigura coniformis]|nr:ThiF family adenylyltransferase [Caulifigura coniformis]